jgi:hypothetical protein
MLEGIKTGRVVKCAIPKSPADARAARLKRLYGLAPGEYETILAAQGGACAICLRPPRPGKNLHVDHRHADGLCRGLLDWGCNAAVAKLRDDAGRAARAAAYLESPPATAALGREVYGRTGRVTTRRRRRARR